jgi:hypothetical protein
MRTNKALFNCLFNHFPMHPARIRMMLEIILSFMKVGSVQQHKVAQGTNINAKTNSIVRRIQRFFAQQVLNPQEASKLIFSLFDWDEKITLTMDRTNWKFGVCDINFLVICAIYKDYSIPLCWVLLPHQGNSNTEQRVNLIEALFRIIPIGRIKFLLGDREFIGKEWFNHLQTINMPFCFRIRENMLVYDVRHGGHIKLEALFRHLLFSESRELRQVVSGTLLTICATRMGTGELLILAVSDDGNLLDAFDLYGRRWTIETMFKAFKSSGFNFEDTHQKNLERLCKIMILLTIAYSWAIKIGEIKNKIKPIKIKINGRPEFSWFSYGLRTVQTILLKGRLLHGKLFCLLANITLNKALLPRLTEITVVY